MKLSPTEKTTPDSRLQVTVVESRAVQYLLTKLRNVDTRNGDFVVFANRISRLMSEEALCRSPFIYHGNVETPSGGVARGPIDVRDDIIKNTCFVSVLTSGEILSEELRKLEPDAPIGKILVEGQDRRSFTKLPKDIAGRSVILTDAAVATGDQALAALSELIRAGVKEENILFLTLICGPEGLERLVKNHPKIRIITASIDEGLSEKNFIVPGLGNFADRFYQTECK